MKHNVRRAQLGRMVDFRVRVYPPTRRHAFGVEKALTRAQRVEINARPHRIAQALEKAVPGLVVDRPGGRPALGGAVPWQLDGTYNGQPCYLRFRHDTGGMTVWADEPFGQEEVLVSRLWNYTGDEWNGSLDDDDEVVQFVQALVAGLAPPSAENTSSQTDMRDAVEAMMRWMKDCPEPVGPGPVEAEIQRRLDQGAAMREGA